MRSLHKIATILALVFSLQTLGLPAFAAQDSKEGGTITGRVLLDGKPASGVVVMATRVASGDSPPTVEQMLKPSAPVKSLTDSQGRYRLEGVPSGTYLIAPSSPTSVNSEQGPGKPAAVVDGGTVEDTDFSLSRGGVITGRITDSDGRAAIAEEISLKLVDPSKPSGSPSWANGRMYITDDRGIYRIFGLTPGKYIISAGGSRDPISSLLAKRPKRAQTYYPGATEETKAKPVEVIAGAEASGIDIKLGMSDKGLTVSGRVVALETGAPMANAMVSYSSRAKEVPSDQARRDDSSDVPHGMTITNAKGEFRLEAVAPGKYSVEVESMGALTGVSEFYADPVTFDVQAADVDKLEVKVHLGASISGVVAVEGADAANTPDTPRQFALIATVTASQMNGGGPSMGRVAADGSFRIGGLRAGKATIRSVPYPYGSEKLSVVRVEREGLPQPDGIDIQSTEQITGIRVVVVPATCVIRGRVTVVGGTLAPGSAMSVWARSLSGDPYASSRAIPDTEGNFVLEGLAPGEYEVDVTVNIRSGEVSRRVSAKQSVTVTNSSPVQTTIVLDIGAKASDK